MRHWNTAFNDPLLDISVVGAFSMAGLPSGGTLLATPRVGGTITGFNFDDKMNVADAPVGTKVPIDGSFTAVSASLTGGHRISAAIGIDSVRLDMLRSDLTSQQQLAKLPGTFVGKPAVVYTNGNRIVPVGTDTGVTVHAFDGSWGWLASKELPALKPTIGMATTQMGAKAMVAWSTASDCHVAMLTAFDASVGSTMAMPCLEPRLASSIAHDDAVLVFETAEDVRFQQIAHGEMDPPTHFIRAGASSPRVLFDGQRYWISYIDARGDVVVGFFDETGHVVSMGLPYTAPQDGAYELALVNGSPWVFAAVNTGYTAQRLCVHPSW